jgi:hypothetical protein
MSQWGTGYNWAAWEVIDHRTTSKDAIERFLTRHSPTCDVDHPINRFWILDREVLLFRTGGLNDVFAAGYTEIALHLLVNGPGGHEIAEMLDHRPDVICLEYHGTLNGWDALDKLDTALFKDRSFVLLQLTGPFPVTDDELAQELPELDLSEDRPMPPSWMTKVLADLEKLN